MSTQISTKTIVQDEGTTVLSNDIINFTGSGVTVSNVGGSANVVIPGPGASTGLVYKGLWDANINNPLLTSGVGIVGNYYIVSTAGTTNLDGTTDWQIGDWAIFVADGPDLWQKIDNHDTQAYNTVKDESTILPQRSTLKFTGTGVTASDSGGETVIDVPGNIAPTTYGLYAQTADSIPVTGTAVETTIIGAGVGTLSVPANAFSIGDSFTCALDGLVTCGASANLRIRVRTLTGILLADTGLIDMSAATDKPWIMNLYFTIRTLGGPTVASISSGGLFSYVRNGGTQFEGYVLSTVNNTTFDTTVSNTLLITAEWDTNVVGNSITSRNFTLTKIY